MFKNNLNPLISKHCQDPICTNAVVGWIQKHTDFCLRKPNCLSTDYLYCVFWRCTLKSEKLILLSWPLLSTLYSCKMCRGVHTLQHESPPHGASERAFAGCRRLGVSFNAQCVYKWLYLRMVLPLLICNHAMLFADFV